MISFPTDTVPALAVRPDDAGLIFAAKHRSLDKPLILMAGEVEDLWAYVQGDPGERRIWQAIAQRYLPGALTLVLPASDRVPVTLNPQHPTSIGVRVPNHAIARAILRRTGPLATTSANLSGHAPLETLPEIEAQFPTVWTLPPQELELLAPGSLRSDAPSGVPSTVIRWNEAGWEVLRQGSVTLEAG